MLLFLSRENGKGWNRDVTQGTLTLVMIFFCFLKMDGGYPRHRYIIILYSSCILYYY